MFDSIIYIYSNSYNKTVDVIAQTDVYSIILIVCFVVLLFFTFTMPNNKKLM